MPSAVPGAVRTWSVILYALQVVVALALPIAFCAYAPASALTWAGVIAIALLGFGLLHGGSAWLVPVSGAIAMASLFWQLPIPRETFLFGSSALAFVVAVIVIRSDIATNRRPGIPRAAAESHGNAQVSARMVDGAILVSWLAPASSGGYPVQSYDVQVSSDGGANWQTIRYVPASERAVVIDDLPGGAEVSFRVAAVNAAGSGSPSRPTAPFIPIGLPGPVTGIQGHPGDGQVRLTWVAPLSDGGYPIVDYVVQVSADSGSTWMEVFHQPSLECIAVAGGLMNGHPYLFRVMAVNGRGRGRPSSPTQALKPAGLPGPPYLNAAQGADRSITVSWSPPAMDGGLPILGYVLETSHDGGSTWVLSDRQDGYVTSTRVSGLVNGIPYQVRISALNAVGRGPSSAPSSPTVPMGVPGEVGEVRVSGPNFSHRAVIDQPVRPRRPVVRALLSAVLVLAGAGLAGYAVMRTMEGDAAFRIGQMTGLESVSAPQDTVPGEATDPAPEPVLDGGSDGSAVPQPSDASMPATVAVDEDAGSPVVEAPQAPATTEAQPVPQVPLGQVVGTLAFYRGGEPIITDSPYVVRQGVGAKVLEKGPGHYPSTPLPGTSGNAAIAGHRTGWGSPFLHLDQLAPGDEIVFTSPDGLVSRYVVDSTLVVKPDETWVLGWDPLQAGMPTLTLTTCDPPHVNTRRLVVFARTAV